MVIHGYWGLFRVIQGYSWVLSHPIYWPILCDFVGKLCPWQVRFSLCQTLHRQTSHFERMKWNDSGFRPPLCTYRLNWARRTFWGWWDDWDDTVFQTQDSKFEPWRSEAEHATSRSRRLPTILTFTREWGRNIFCFFQTAETGNRTPNSGVKGSGANHYPRAPALERMNKGLCLSHT